MTPDQMAQLQGVNAQVNAVPYDAAPRVGEYAGVWKDTPDDGLWVCRCYVLDKEKLLRGLGWSASAMTVVECYTENDEYHAVLCVEADGEDWILDSRFPQVYRWDQAPAAYRWDRRQLAGSTQFESIA